MAKSLDINAIVNHHHPFSRKAVRDCIVETGLRIHNDQICKTGQPAFNSIQESVHPTVLFQIHIGCPYTPDNCCEWKQWLQNHAKNIGRAKVAVENLRPQLTDVSN